MTRQKLEKYLWGAATYLRGNIDAGDDIKQNNIKPTIY